jgi:hypothetical protein
MTGGELPVWDIRASLDAGRRCEAEADLDGARRAYLVALALDPASTDAARAITVLDARRREAALSAGKALLDKGDLRAACSRLREAAAGEGGSDEARRLLERQSHREYDGEWLHRDEIVEREKAEASRARSRARELGLGPAFRCDRRGDVRLHSDHAPDQLLPFTRELHEHVARLRREHGQLFAALLASGETDAVRPADIDIVLFRRREEYLQATAAEGTAGIFLPERGASFFYLGEAPPEEVAGVLLHELTHQLDFKVLGLVRPPPWLEEGIASWLEAGGKLSAGHEARLREKCPPASDRWWGLERLTALPDARPLYASYAVHDFYAQSAHLVRCLLEGGPEWRAVFFILVERAQEPGSRAADGWKHFRETLAARGLQAAALEEMLKARCSR